MSTLYDALKKAEAENKKTAVHEEKIPQGGKALEVGQMQDNAKAIILLIAVIVVFIFAFWRIKGTLEGSQKSAVQHMVSVTSLPKAESAPVKPRMPGTYDLDGTVDAGENSMAIINGKLLKIEGTIDNLILKKIFPKEVELLNAKNNSTVILKIK